jgi:hypothetical protein
LYWAQLLLVGIAGANILLLMSRAPSGLCHLCGTYGKLSYEHVPPKAAFNDRPLVAKAMDQLIKNADMDQVKGKIYQRGAGAYTLCPGCNNNTGSWYGRDYVNWVYNGMHILRAANSAPSLYYTFHVLPLRVIKQIICMFFSVNGHGFRTKNQYLERFVLNKSLRHLPDDVSIYTFYAAGRAARQSSVSSLLNLNAPDKNTVFSEICFPPFGYIMAFGNPPDVPLLDISYFARYGYDDYRALDLKLPVLPVVSYLPGDYRTQAELDACLKGS